MTEDGALQALGDAVGSLMDFSKWLHDNDARNVAAGSDLEADVGRSGSDLIPKELVESLLVVANDHLHAWLTLVNQGEEEPLLSLHVSADLTLLRPVIEGFASIIWILGNESQDVRLRRALNVSVAELRQLQRYLTALSKANIPDADLQEASNRYGEALLEATERAGLNPLKTLPERAVDPSSIMRGAGQFVPGPQLDVYRHWAIASSHTWPGARYPREICAYHGSQRHRRECGGEHRAPCGNPYIYREEVGSRNGGAVE